MADDNSAFLRELTSLLAAEFDVVATAVDGKSALDLIRRYKPDLVVLELGMPVLNGIEVSRELAKSSSSPPVVICSVETDPEVVEAAQAFPHCDPRYSITQQASRLRLARRRN